MQTPGKPAAAAAAAAGLRAEETLPPPAYVVVTRLDGDTVTGVKVPNPQATTTQTPSARLLR